MASKQQSIDKTNIIFSLGVFLAYFSLLSSITRLWSLDGIKVIPSGSYGIAVGVITCLFTLVTKKFKWRQLKLEPYGFAIGLCLLFLLDWLCRGYNFFQGPSIRGELILFAIVGLFLLQLPSFSWIKYVLVGSCIFLIYNFLIESQGRLIFSDDHATFFYRMQLLKENFPWIPFYNPLWNAGLDARDFFATGSLNFFLLFSPLIYALPLEAIYNCLLLSLMFILFPLSLYFSAQIQNFKAPVPWLSALLGLSLSIQWYTWSFKYGTLGFVTACVLMPLTVAYCFKIFEKPESFSWWSAVIFTVSTTLMLCWSASGIALLPLVLLALIWSPQLLRYKNILLSAALLVMLNLPWVLIFWSASNVSTFLKSEETTTIDSTENFSRTKFKHKSGEINISDALEGLRSAAHATNPLILVFSLPGVFLLSGLKRRLYCIVLGWLVLLGTIAVPLKPQLELDRMLLVAALLACIPTAAAIVKLFTQHGNSSQGYRKIPLLLVVGFLLAGPLVSASFLRNRSSSHYYFADKNLSELRSFMNQNPETGRIMFAGCVIHELSHGHLAPLTLFTQKPIIASSHVHNLWRYKDVIPSYFLQRAGEGKQEYMDLMNVTGIYAHEVDQKKYFRKHPEFYQELWHNRAFTYFKRKNYQSNYFLKGSGEVLEQTNNKLRLKLNSNQAVIKFKYFPFLVSSECKLSPYNVAPELNLILVSECQSTQNITIKSGNPLSRIGLSSG